MAPFCILNNFDDFQKVPAHIKYGRVSPFSQLRRCVVRQFPALIAMIRHIYLRGKCSKSFVFDKLYAAHIIPYINLCQQVFVAGRKFYSLIAQACLTTCFVRVFRHASQIDDEVMGLWVTSVSYTTIHLGIVGKEHGIKTDFHILLTVIFFVRLSLGLIFLVV